MNKRIEELTRISLTEGLYPTKVKTEFDREDAFLPRQQRESKRLCEYILNQNPVITKYSKMTGFFAFDGSVVDDAFHRIGHKHFDILRHEFYLKPIDNLSTCEWQHATADYEKVLAKGIRGIIDEIDESLKVHTSEEETEFLNALKKVAETLIKWAHKCADAAIEFSKTVEEKEYKENLENLAATLHKVPENKPENFFEAVLTIYVCFAADPDSVGTLDRYLYPFYKNDIEKGIITKDEAKEYLQELFLMLQGATWIGSYHFTRGGQSHFCIGGYLPNGEDGFTELSYLILESLMELPTYIPQVSIRWTSKMPKEALRYAMDCERHDPHKRIAFQNDEKRIKCYTEICGFPFEKAVKYTTVGCNEPAFLGAITGSNSKINILRCMETIFHKENSGVLNCNTYEEFYEIFLKELLSDIETALS